MSIIITESSLVLVSLLTIRVRALTLTLQYSGLMLSIVQILIRINSTSELD